MILYVVIGFASGIISGMGIGGGTILIPALGILCNIEQHSAQNINLIYFVPTACIALISHVKQKNVEKENLFALIIFGFISASIGSFIAIKIDPQTLRRMFGFFLLIMGFVEFFRRDNKINKT